MISKVVEQIRYGYHHALDSRNWGYIEVIPNHRFIIINKASMVYKGKLLRIIHNILNED